MARSIRLAGAGPRRHHPCRRRLRACSPGGSARTTASSVLGATVVPVSGGMTERQVQLIQDFAAARHDGDPDVLLLSLLDQMEREGIDPATTSLERRRLRRRAVDRVDAPGDRAPHGGTGRRRLQRPLGGDGARRRAGRRRTTKDGLHIWEDDFYPEIIDPITEEVLPDGEVGELVFTSLTKAGDAGDPLPHRAT